VIEFVKKSLNVQVKEVRLKNLDSSHRMWSVLMRNGQGSCYNVGKLMANSSSKPINPYIEVIKSVCGLQNKYTLPALSMAINERVTIPNAKGHIEMANSLRQEVKEILGDDGIMFFPSFPCVAPYHNRTVFCNSFDYIYYGIINVMGLPCTQCPMGLSPQGLPTGVQVVANQNNDHLTIKFAEFLESNLIGWIPPS
jgi:fatty acid amide hydrolase 2